MRILDVSQADETEAWLEARKGKITGSAGDGQLSSKLGMAFWSMLAERIAAPADDENAAERGHRLENINAQLTVEAHHLQNPLYDTKLWVREDYPDIAVSPDCRYPVSESFLFNFPFHHLEHALGEVETRDFGPRQASGYGDGGVSCPAGEVQNLERTSIDALTEFPEHGLSPGLVGVQRHYVIQAVVTAGDVVAQLPDRFFLLHMIL